MDSSSSTCTWSLLGIAVMVFSAIVLYGTRLYKNPLRLRLPLGAVGWPFVGETIDFISCAYSDRPETFMDKRRLL